MLLLVACQSTEQSNNTYPETKEWSIALHGGAGAVSKDMPEERQQAYMESLEEALTIGAEILENGGSALDAIEKTVNYL
ncbi:MAG TPA: beta-aspartyl-peptidase, partial [Balneolaceae bacterium]|nr:beta-aspartyl-peptidase [Balneolaceae bacterium]